ncbi:MAG: aminomethyl-transferring glycine dehydrogenase [Ignavibacteriae bacterium]|nr:aminomethyl-transferring glycine dehydrogenase [Ignavibacteriota bacterium]
MNSLLNENGFQARHIGPNEEETKAMLQAIGAASLDQLIDETVPASIRLKKPLDLPEPMSEYRFLRTMRELAGKNKLYRSFLGQGYYPCVTPPVIQRNVFENPGWYTQYTPYQAEISQGRLQALLNFQTMVMDLTGMEVANASLLDEGTAAGEAMTMLYGIVNRQQNGSPRNKFFVSSSCFIQTIEVVKSRALPLGIEVVIDDWQTTNIDKSFFGVLVQYPAEDGLVSDYRAFIENAHAAGALAVVASDLLSLALLTPPGEFGADVVLGNSQRFGVPMGYGGPHAAFFATKNEHIRNMPGRIIGVSIDSRNTTAFRMTLQTREQHIRREKATSNICTAQALLAIMAGMYAVYHGPEGIRRIAQRVHSLASVLDKELTAKGYKQTNAVFFDTLKIAIDDKALAQKIHALASEAKINFRRIDDTHIGITLDEATLPEEVETIGGIFAGAKGGSVTKIDWKKSTGSVTQFPKQFQRTSTYLQHPIFNRYHSESEMMRYIKSLENKDLSLTHSMISLGSCTMKLNAAAELMPVSFPEFSQLHPFVPAEQAEGYRQAFTELEQYLCRITGFAATSLQPNSGAQGELSGLMVIRAYHQDRGQGHRNVALIPSSAHGTNPASATMAGMKVVVVNCDDSGNIDIDDLKLKAEAYKDNLAAFMATYPSTFGVFEEHIKEVCDIIHKHGGQVYLDGANMNAQVGLTSPASVGADVCHINLHKTFAIPHGGGGPGMGPICVAEHLVQFLPNHPVVKTGGNKGIPAVASAPWSSASILLISYGYIKMLGGQGVTDASRYAILNANYLKAKLEPLYPVLYQGSKKRVAHEFILNTKIFKDMAGVEVEDIAKRLMDYGFHAPTVSFPVAGTLMIEPTESEAKAELDRFVEAMASIRKEIEDIADGKADKTDNVLKNAPHTMHECVGDEWKHSYTREQAAFPAPYVKHNKFWPAVARINNTYGDRNIICACPPIETYAEVLS